MNYPGYYSKYLSKFAEIEDFDARPFLEYLDNLNAEDFRELINDLISNNPYPTRIQKYRKDYSTLGYFAEYFSQCSAITQRTIAEVVDEIGISILAGGTHFKKEIENLIEFVRQFESGLSPDILIDSVILNDRLPSDLRFNAALALSSFNDETTITFWKFKSKYRVSEFNFLALPRFVFLLKHDAVEAFSSIIYLSVDFRESIELDLALEDFFYFTLNKEDVWQKVVSIYRKLPDWLIDRIDSLLIADDFLKIRTYLIDNFNVIQLGEKSLGYRFSKYLSDNLKVLNVPIIEGLRPFDQDYFIEYADSLGLFKFHGYRLNWVSFQNYPKSFGILKMEELALALKPAQFLSDNEVKANLPSDKNNYSHVAIVDRFRGPSLAGAPFDRSALADTKTGKYLDDLYRHYLSGKIIQTFDPSAEKYLGKFVFQILSNAISGREYNVDINYKYYFTEKDLFAQLKKGHFILTTGQLYAAVVKNGYGIYLTPEDVSSITLRSGRSGYDYQKLMAEESIYGIHNVLLINRGKHSDSNEDARKIASIALSLSEHISKEPEEFARFIEKKWNEQVEENDFRLSFEAIVEALKMSYQFCPIEDYERVYLNPSSNSFFRDDIESIRAMYDAIYSDLQLRKVYKAEMEKMFTEKQNEFLPGKLAQMVELKKDYDFCDLMGLHTECQELYNQYVNFA